MALAGSVSKAWFDGKKFWAIVAITASGSYPTGGDTLALNIGGTAGANVIRSSQVPFYGDVQGQAGYMYCWVPGTTIANGKVKVFQSGTASAAFNELPAAAYPAGITGDTIVGDFRFELR